MEIEQQLEKEGACTSESLKCHGKRPTSQDIFTAPVKRRKDLSVSNSSSAELSAALAQMGEVTSHNISESTRLTYTQVYRYISEYAASLSPPVVLDITRQAIPADVIISYFRYLFTGKGKSVACETEEGVPIQTASGVARTGKSLSESTFRKEYHALKTLHIHFQSADKYQYNPDTKLFEGNPCQDPAVKRVYAGYLKMFHSPADCKQYGRAMKQEDRRAKVLRIPHLIALYNSCQLRKDAYALRGWTYILLSCALFLRKGEAAALRISDIDVPTDPATGKIELQPEGLPRFLFVTIQRSKTDQEGQGQRLLLRRNQINFRLCPVLTLITWLTVLKHCYGLTCGAVFPNLSRSGLGRHMDKEAFRKIFKRMMKNADLDDCGFKTHSCRRTAAYYAAWLQIPETTIKILGRWDSQVYQTYVQSADLERREWEEVRGEETDPIKENFNIFGSV